MKETTVPLKPDIYQVLRVNLAPHTAVLMWFSPTGTPGCSLFISERESTFSGQPPAEGTKPPAVQVVLLHLLAVLFLQTNNRKYLHKMSVYTIHLN